MKRLLPLILEFLMTKTCPQCQKSFVAQRTDKTFCSSTCRSKASASRSRFSQDTAADACDASGQTENEVQPVQHVQSVQPVQNDQPIQPRPSVQPRQTFPPLNELNKGASQSATKDSLLVEDLMALRKQEQHLATRLSFLTNRHTDIPRLIPPLKTIIGSKVARVKWLEERVQLSDADLFDTYLNKLLADSKARGSSYASMHAASRRTDGKLMWGNDESKVTAQRKIWDAELQPLLEQQKQARKQLLDLETELESLPKVVQLISDQLRDARSAIARLHALHKPLMQARPISNNIQSVSPTPSRKSTKSYEVSVEDLLSTYFDSFTLPTPFGNFLGRLDRNKLAFALTGDSGAGKSHLAFAFAKLFSDEGYRTKIYSLEEGLGRLAQEKVRKYDLSNDVILAGAGTLVDVRRDAAIYDLIIIDSFSKLGVDAAEFENLRSDFPHTIFVIIFQKTSAGTMRGGASILFNSSATIDVTKEGDERIATMVKSRYGTMGWRYSITESRVESL